MTDKLGCNDENNDPVDGTGSFVLVPIVCFHIEGGVTASDPRTLKRQSICAPEKYCTVRLSVRTHAFHVCKTGSIPVPCTNYVLL